MSSNSMTEADSTRNAPEPRERFYALKEFERQQRRPYLLRLIFENADEIIVTTNSDGSPVILGDLIADQDWTAVAVAYDLILGMDQLPRDRCMVCHPGRCERGTCGNHHDDSFRCSYCHNDAGDAAADRDNGDGGDNE